VAGGLAGTPDYSPFHYGAHLFDQCNCLRRDCLAKAKVYDASDVEVAGLYWHFVDLVWMFVSAVYLMSTKYLGDSHGRNSAGMQKGRRRAAASRQRHILMGLGGAARLTGMGLSRLSEYGTGAHAHDSDGLSLLKPG